MTLEDMKDKRKELGYSYKTLEKLSGVPYSTIQKIFSGKTQKPRRDTMQMLESVLGDEDLLSYNTDVVNHTMLHEEARAYEFDRQGEYTVEDYYNLPDDVRAELIDGYLIYMDAPTANHQEIAGEIHRQIANFIIDKNCKCSVFISPISVQLDCDNRTMVQPDVVLLCDEAKNTNKCIYGAPDFVLEVISKSTRRKDYSKKKDKYKNAGVREYWIVDPYKRVLVIHYFEKEVSIICGLDESVTMGICDKGLKIDFARINQIIDKYAAYLK